VPDGEVVAADARSVRRAAIRCTVPQLCGNEVHARELLGSSLGRDLELSGRGPSINSRSGASVANDMDRQLGTLAVGRTCAPRDHARSSSWPWSQMGPRWGPRGRDSVGGSRNALCERRECTGPTLTWGVIGAGVGAAVGALIATATD